MKKILNLAYKIRYIALFFVLFIAQSLSVCDFGLPKLAAVSYTVHLLDYGFGFCARFLPGQLYKWITGGDYSYLSIQAYERVLLLIAFLLISILVNKFIMSAPEKSRKWYVIFALFYCVGPMTFSLYSYGLGIIDSLWIIFTPLFLFMLGNKYLKFAAPLLVIPMVLVHFTVMTCYVVLLLFILIYHATELTDKKQKGVWTALFFATLIIGVAFSAYFILFESSNAKYTAEETTRIVNERSQIGDQTDLVYINFDIFRVVSDDNSMVWYEGTTYPYKLLTDDILIPEGSTNLPAFLVNAINAAWPNFNFHLTYYFSEEGITKELAYLMSEFFFLIPTIAFVMMYWVHRMRIAKEENNKLQRFIFLLAIIYMPIALVFWFFFSVDYYRYFNHILIVEGGFMMYVMMCNTEDASKWLKNEFTSYDKSVFVMYSALYFLRGMVI